MMNLRRTKSQVKYSLLYLYYLDMQQKYLEVYALVLIDTYLIKKAICIAVLKWKMTNFRNPIFELSPTF